MFKAHRGICSCGCGKEGIIVVKKGYIAQCNHRIKNEKKKKEKSTPPPSRIYVAPTPEEKQRAFEKLKERFQANQLKMKARPLKRTPLKRTPLKKKFPKKSGEKEVFERIWNTREHKCEVCGKPVKRVNGGVGMFSHVLSKGADVSMRLDEENILIKGDGLNGNCDHHRQWELRTEEMREIEMWKPIFLLLDALKRKSNVTNKPNYNFKPNEEEQELGEKEVITDEENEIVPEEDDSQIEIADEEDWNLSDEERSI